MAQNNGQPETILVTRFSALGDVALAIPELYNVCQANPDKRFVMLTAAHPASMFINRPANLTVEGVMLSRYRGADGMNRLLAEMREKYGVKVIVDLHDVIRTKLIRTFGVLRGIRSVKLKKGRRGKNRLTRRRNKIVTQLQPTYLRYREAFERAGLKTADSFRTIFPEKADPEVYAAATGPKQPGEKWIAIAPFAKHAGKIYPMELMEKVIENYGGREGHKIFIFGFGTNETETIAGWAEKYGSNIVNMAALRIGLGSELALLSDCDVMLSMDSANMHLASLVGLRAVSVWGATHPFAGFMGWKQKPEDAVQLDMTCRPCSVFGNKPCIRGDYHCLHGISPQLIIDRIDEKH